MFHLFVAEDIFCNHNASNCTGNQSDRFGCCSCRIVLFCTDEKEKYDPSAFRDSIAQGLAKAQGDIEQVRIDDKVTL